MMDVLFLFVLCGATAAVSVVVYTPRPRRVCDVRMVFGSSIPTADHGAGPLADHDNFG
jgi:hypothetical protein